MANGAFDYIKAQLDAKGLQLRVGEGGELLVDAPPGPERCPYPYRLMPLPGETAPKLAAREYKNLMALAGDESADDTLTFRGVKAPVAKPWVTSADLDWLGIPSVSEREARRLNAAPVEREASRVRAMRSWFDYDSNALVLLFDLRGGGICDCSVAVHIGRAELEDAVSQEALICARVRQAFADPYESDAGFDALVAEARSCVRKAQLPALLPLRSADAPFIKSNPTAWLATAFAAIAEAMGTHEAIAVWARDVLALRPPDLEAGGWAAVVMSEFEATEARRKDGRAEFNPWLQIRSPQRHADTLAKACRGEFKCMVGVVATYPFRDIYQRAIARHEAPPRTWAQGKRWARR